MGSPGFVPEPVEHSQRRASRAGFTGLGNANYQTKVNPDRYSETRPKPLTLELLWILRALLNAADTSYRFYVDCAFCEDGIRLAGFFGIAAEACRNCFSPVRVLILALTIFDFAGSPL